MPKPELPKMSTASTNKALVNDAKEHSQVNIYEQERSDEKQLLKDMLVIYKAFAAKDQNLTDALAKVEALANFNNSATKEFAAEVNAYKDAILALEKYQEKFQDMEKALHDETLKKLGKYDENNNFVDWYSEEEIQQNPQLIKAEADIAIKQNELENSQHLVADLLNYLQIQKNGSLEKSAEDPQARHINASGLSFDMADYDFGMGKIADNVINWGQNHGYYTKNMKDWPLFPHEPNVNDVRQGAVNDCFYISGLSSIAQSNPEFIKKSMRDNGDGTVTVRLFSKSKEGEYAPVYVTVDKTVPQYYYVPKLGQTSGGSKFSLWVVCYEKALAASGLYSYAKADMKYWQPIPENSAEIYEELKALQKSGELTGEILAQKKEAYPWAFMNPNKDDPKEELLPWPNYNSISGGFALHGVEMVLGPDFKGKQFEIPEKQTADSVSVIPKTTEQFVALGLLNITGDLVEKRVGERKINLNLATSRDELIDQVWDYLEAGRLANKRTINKLYSSIPNFSKDVFSRCFDSFVRTINQKLAENHLEPNVKNFGIVASDLPVEQDLNNRDIEREIGSQRMIGNIVRMGALLNTPRYNDGEEKLYSDIRRMLDMKNPVNAGSRKSSEIMFGGHQYTVLNVYEGDDGRKYVTLRNPWGDTARKNGLSTTFNSDGTHKLEWVHVQDGIFDMELDDFVQEFDEIDTNGYDINEITLVNDEPLLGSFEIADEQIFNDRKSMEQFMCQSLIKSFGNTDALSELHFDEIGPENFKIYITKLFTKADKEADNRYEDPAELKNIMKSINKSVSDLYDTLSTAVRQYYKNHPNPDKLTLCSDLKDFFSSELEKVGDPAFMETPDGRLAQKLLGQAARFFSYNENAVKKNNPAPAEKLNQFYDKLSSIISKKDANLKIYYQDEEKISTKSFKPEIIDVFTDKKGIKCAKVLVEKGKERITPLQNIFMQSKQFTIQDNRPEVVRGEKSPMHDFDFTEAKDKQNEWIAKQPKENVSALEEQAHVEPENRQVSVSVIKDYLKILNDVDTVFGATKQRWNTSSPEYGKLFKELKSVRSDLAKSINAPFEKISKIMDRLEPLLNAYDIHCNDEYKDNWRRNARRNGCQVLRGVIAAVKNCEKKPMEAYERSFAQKITQKMMDDNKIPENKDLTKQISDMLVNNRAFKGYVYNNNLVDIATAKGNYLQRHIKNLDDIRHKHVKEDTLDKDIKKKIEQLEPKLI